MANLIEYVQEAIDFIFIIFEIKKMRLTLVICILLFNHLLCAQNTVVTLKQSNEEYKKKPLPFYFKEVVVSDEISDTIGVLRTHKTRGNIFALLPKNKSIAILDFIRNQFFENKKGQSISLHITKLTLAPTEKDHFSPKDTFQFQCKFYADATNKKPELFSFKAKHPFGNFENDEVVLANYICRAVISAIEKFTDFHKKNGSWMLSDDMAANIDKKTIQVLLQQNNIKSPDSIPCTTSRILSWDDFQETPSLNAQRNNDHTDLGSAKCILTYRVISEETNRYLKLEIFVNAFFYKKNSWKPKNKNPEWLAYQQGHFDLCAIFGNQLSQKMQNHMYSLGTYKTELNTIYNELNAEFVSLRKQYQSETQEGRDADQMSLWRKKIDVLLRNR